MTVARGKRHLLAAGVVLLCVQALHSGGVLIVAGPIGFNPDAVGKPITWANHTLTYYTDLGDLSAAMPQDSANTLVAEAFSRWSAVPSAALTIERGGSLAQDVNGSNVQNNNGSVTMPADVQANATSRPLGVIYDQDGSVTDSLLGAGAGAASLCATNSVYGGADAYTPDAHFAHALLVVNGKCLQSAQDVPDIRYRLVRVTGRILGVGWSQLNDNVRTGSPAPGSEDLAGFPVMHPRGPVCAGHIADCLPDADQLRMDDRASIAYLYPAAGSSQSIRIRGSVFFSAENGGAGQPMQGVNVVARLLDPVSGKASRVFAAASVTGFRFRGNNGNPVTGGVTAQGEPYARFGSGDVALQGYYELVGLEVPAGLSQVSYQLTLESLNPSYKGDFGVGAFRYGVTAPSGNVSPVVVSNLSAGADVTRNIVVGNSARERQDTAEPNGFLSPWPVPAGGSWWATLSDYGDSDFYSFRVRAGRSFHLRVTALDESFSSSAVKAQPALGLWEKGAPLNAVPLVRSLPFNVAQNGQTRLSAASGADTDLVFGVADFRGDGRPDYLYHVRLLYADALIPSRVPAGGGVPVILQGYGFNANTSVSIGGVNAPVLNRSGSRLLLQAPALGNGTANLVVTDLATGDAATITGAATFGVAAGDQMTIVAGGNSGIPVGATARTPTRVRVTAADGATPVAGTLVTFSASPAQSFLVQCNANPCGVVTDALGEAAANLAVRAVGENTVSASIASGAHLEDTVVGIAPATSVYATVISHRVPQGTTMAIPLSVKVLSAGNPVPGQLVTFTLGSTPTSGTAVLGASAIVTDSAGDATDIVSVASLGSGFTVIVCLSGGSACTTINVLALAPASLQMQVLSGGNQIIAAGQAATPVILRVTDGNPNQPVKRATISVATSVFARLRAADCNLKNADCQPASARPLASSTATLVTDDNGLASFTPTIQSSWGAANIYARFSAGAGVQSTTIQIYK